MTESVASKLRRWGKVVDPGGRRDAGVGPTIEREKLSKSLKEDNIHFAGTKDPADRKRLKRQIAAKQKALAS